MKRKYLAGCLLFFILLCVTGCESVSTEGSRGKDWDYTVVPVRDYPENFKNELEKKKVNKFQMTYDDGESLYIAVGYGEQPSGGYSIQVQGVYEKGDNLCVETSLNGPDEEDIVKNKCSYPYLVVKVEKTEKKVEFL